MRVHSFGDLENGEESLSQTNTNQMITAAAAATSVAGNIGEITWVTSGNTTMTNTATDMMITASSQNSTPAIPEMPAKPNSMNVSATSLTLTGLGHYIQYVIEVRDTLSVLELH